MALSMTPKAGGGFAFTDANGNPISAYTYSQLSGTPFYDLLTSMAAKGDSGALSVLDTIGNTPGGQAQDAAQINGLTANSGSPNTALSALTWAGASPTLTGGSTGGGGSSSPTLDPAVLAFLGSQADNINNILGTLDSQKETGIANVRDQSTAALNKEGLSYDQATRDYNTNKSNTVQDELTAKQNIDTGVRQNTTALQRLLGLAGSGSSSASEIVAPYAASRVGNVQRQGVQTTYGRNLQSLDTNFGDTTTQHDMNVGDINAQTNNQVNSVASGIESTRQSLLQQLASLTAQKDQAAGKTLTQAQADIKPYMDQVNQALGVINGLQRLSVNLAKPSAYTPPPLDSYNVDNSAKISGTGANTNLPYADQINPYVINPQDPIKQKQNNGVLVTA